MKTTYQQFNSMFVKFCGARARAQGISRDEAAKQAYNNPEFAHTDKMAFAVQSMVFNGENCTHVFVKDEAFLDWLIECVPTLEDGSPDAMREMAGGKILVFHFPTSSKHRCLACEFLEPQPATGNKTAVIISFSCDVSEFQTPGCIVHGCIVYGGQIHNIGPRLRMAGRLLNGLGLYLSCFPEMLKAGPPDDVKHPAHHQYEVSKTVDIAPQVRVHGEQGEVTPHFRVGHFRTLRSDRFTHKRFKVVFVKACFVKGESLTILSPEEAV